MQPMCHGARRPSGVSPRPVDAPAAQFWTVMADATSGRRRRFPRCSCGRHRGRVASPPNACSSWPPRCRACAWLARAAVQNEGFHIILCQRNYRRTRFAPISHNDPPPLDHNIKDAGGFRVQLPDINKFHRFASFRVSFATLQV